jgi:hypothetical protein
VNFKESLVLRAACDSAGPRCDTRSRKCPARAALLIEKTYVQDIARLFDHAENGRTIRNAGFGDDLIACAVIDSHPVLAAYENGIIRKRDPNAVRSRTR